MTSQSSNQGLPVSKQSGGANGQHGGPYLYYRTKDPKTQVDIMQAIKASSKSLYVATVGLENIYSP